MDSIYFLCYTDEVLLCKSEKIVLLLRRDFFKTGTTVNDSLKSGGKLKTFEKDVIKQGEATIATVQIKIREKVPNPYNIL